MNYDSTFDNCNISFLNNNKDMYRGNVRRIYKNSFNLSKNLKDASYIFSSIPYVNTPSVFDQNHNETLPFFNKNSVKDHANNLQNKIDSFDFKMNFDILKLKIKKLNYLKDKEMYHSNKKSYKYTFILKHS